MIVYPKYDTMYPKYPKYDTVYLKYDRAYSVLESMIQCIQFDTMYQNATKESFWLKFFYVYRFENGKDWLEQVFCFWLSWSSSISNGNCEAWAFIFNLLQKYETNIARVATVLYFDDRDL